jgi:hypothetical protein
MAHRRFSRFAAAPGRAARSMAARRGPMPGTDASRPLCAAISNASKVSTSSVS